MKTLLFNEQKAVEDLEKILDLTLGKNRGPQIPNHTGNGQWKEGKDNGYGKSSKKYDVKAR